MHKLHAKQNSAEKWFSEHENGSNHDRDCAWRAQETIRKDNDRNEHKLALIAAADRRKKLREEEKGEGEKEKAKLDKAKGKGKGKKARMRNSILLLCSVSVSSHYFDDAQNEGYQAHPEHDSTHMTFNDPGKDRWLTAINRQFRFRRSSALDPVTSSCVKANSFSYEEQRHHEGDNPQASVPGYYYQGQGSSWVGCTGEYIGTQAHVFVLEPHLHLHVLEGNETQAQRQVHCTGVCLTTDYLAYLRVRNLVFADALTQVFNTCIQTIKSNTRFDLQDVVQRIR